MVVEVKYEYLFKYPFEMVSKVHLDKYHSGKDPNVISVETTEETIDSEGRIYQKRVANCKNVIPFLLRRIPFLNEKFIQLEEECWIDPIDRTMLVKSRNITWYSYAQLWERSTFKPQESNDNCTQFNQEGEINLESFGRFGGILERFCSHFMKGGVQKSWKIMEDILAEKALEMAAAAAVEQPQVTLTAKAA